MEVAMVVTVAAVEMVVVSVAAVDVGVVVNAGLSLAQAMRG